VTLDADEVLAALRAAYPEIPEGAKITMGFTGGPGPGSFKNGNGTVVRPQVSISFELEPKDAR